MSDKIILILLITYFVILVVSIFEKNYTRAEYWLGAMLIIHATMKLK